MQKLNQRHPLRNINILIQIADLGVFLPLDIARDRQLLANQDFNQS